MRVYEIKNQVGFNTLAENTLEGVVTFLENCDVGDKLTIDISEMSEIEFNGLPEFQGF
jgi:hypothetical protein